MEVIKVQLAGGVIGFHEEMSFQGLSKGREFQSMGEALKKCFR